MNIGIVGVGLIGGSYARSLKPHGHHIIGINRSQATLDIALENNFIDEGYLDPSLALGKCDVVFICLYPQTTADFMYQNKEYFKQNAVVSDVAGIKRYMLDKINPLDFPNLEFVYAHPIAGRESKGITYSSDTVFQGANFVITPHDGNTEANLQLIEKLAEEMGFKNISRMTPIEHDDIISYTSQLVHVIALALMNSDDDSFDTKKYIGDSFKSLTRIMNVNEPLWAELFLTNKDVLRKRVDLFEEQLAAFKAALDSDNDEKLIEMLSEARKRRGELL